MAIAQRTTSVPGVKRGYKPKAKRSVRHEPSAVERAAGIFKQTAREIRAFIEDEIVYATMDTLRLLGYFKYQLGIQTRARVEPVVEELEHLVHEHELVHDAGTFAAEQVRVLAKR